MWLSLAKKEVEQEYLFWPIEWLNNGCLSLYLSLWDFVVLEPLPVGTPGGGVTRSSSEGLIETTTTLDTKSTNVSRTPKSLEDTFSSQHTFKRPLCFQGDVWMAYQPQKYLRFVSGWNSTTPSLWYIGTERWKNKPEARFTKRTPRHFTPTLFHLQVADMS